MPAHAEPAPSSDLTLFVGSDSSYTLPLLPGYNPAVNVRSSLAVTSPGGGSIIHAMEHAEERGYEGSYFPLEETEGASGENGGQSSQQQQQQEGQEGDRAGMHGGERERPKLDMESNSIPDLPVDLDPPSSSSASAVPLPLSATAAALEEESASTAAAASLSLSSSPEASLATSPLLHSPGHSAASFPSDPPPPPAHPLPPLSAASKAPKLAEALFFDYGVSVFFGLTEHEERQVLEDCEGADGCWVGSLGEPGDAPEERGWEMEECHFEYDPTVAYPRIFNGSSDSSPARLFATSVYHDLHLHPSPFAFGFCPDNSTPLPSVRSHSKTCSPSSRPRTCSSSRSHTPSLNQPSFQSTRRPSSRQRPRPRTFRRSSP